MLQMQGPKAHSCQKKRSHHNASEFWENTPALHKETRHKVGTDICPSDSSTLYFELTKFHAFTLHSCSVISLTNPVNINSKKPVRLKKEGVARSQFSPEDKHTQTHKIQTIPTS